MKRFHLDLLGGMAGDMFVAAMLDLCPELEAELTRVLAACPLLGGVEMACHPHGDGILNGSRFEVALKGEASARQIAPEIHHHHDHGDHDHEHDHDHHDHAAVGAHNHVAWRDIRLALEQMPVDGGIIRRAVGIFSELAMAEGRVHGMEPEAVAFHEVGAWDSVADILAASVLIEAVGPARWTCGSVPIGSGRVRTAHGLLPVPAPATAILLEGFEMIDDGIGGERVTPTGAAILRHLCAPAERSAAEPARLTGSGHGFGTRRLKGVSNCLRILAFEASDQAARDVVAVLECEIDDQTGEDLALALQRIRAHPSVLDALQSPVFGKKGRMMTHLRILAEPAAMDAVADLVFEETTTIGLRQHLVHRRRLPRETHGIADGNRQWSAKTTQRPGGATTKIEADELADVAGQAARDGLRRRLGKAEEPE